MEIKKVTSFSKSWKFNKYIFWFMKIQQVCFLNHEKSRSKFSKLWKFTMRFSKSWKFNKYIFQIMEIQQVLVHFPNRENSSSMISKYENSTSTFSISWKFNKYAFQIIGFFFPNHGNSACTISKSLKIQKVHFQNHGYSSSTSIIVPRLLRKWGTLKLICLSFCLSQKL